MTTAAAPLPGKTDPLQITFAQTVENRESIWGISPAAQGALAAAVHAALEQRAVGSTVTETVRIWKWAMFETRTIPVLTSAANFVSPLEFVKAIVVAQFSAIAQVAYIYLDVVQSAPMFSIFVEGEHYDDAVMDRLLEIELTLQDRFSVSFHLTFNYLPYTRDGDPRQTVRYSARCIFERPYGISH